MSGSHIGLELQPEANIYTPECAVFNWSGLRGRELLHAFSQTGIIYFSFLPAVLCKGGTLLEAIGGADARALGREDTLLTFLPAPLILLAEFTVSIFPGTLSSL